MADYDAKLARGRDLSQLWGIIKGRFAEKTTTVNGKPLSGNVALSHTDVGACKLITGTATLSTSWSSNQQTISSLPVKSGDTVLVTPAPGSYVNYHKWQVRCSSQGDGTLTFTRGSTTTGTLSVQYLILRN